MSCEVKWGAGAVGGVIRQSDAPAIADSLLRALRAAANCEYENVA
jgi:hypothetical protein